MTLNYKQIPYTESFISYPDIAAFTKRYNIPDDKSFGRPTLPAILHYDPSGKLVKAMGNSIDIARYLDEVSPERPVLASTPAMKEAGWGNAAEAYHAAARTVLNGPWAAGYSIVMPTIPKILDETGSKWFIEDRKSMDDSGKGRSPEDWGSDDSEEDWKTFIPPLKALARSLEHTTEEAPFVLGSKPSYHDFALAGYMTWYKRGSEKVFERMIVETGGESSTLARHYKACEQWVLGEGRVVKYVQEGFISTCEL
jgi:glutathione S-transferase